MVGRVLIQGLVKQKKSEVCFKPKGEELSLKHTSLYKNLISNQEIKAASRAVFMETKQNALAVKRNEMLMSVVSSKNISSPSNNIK